MEFKVLSPEDRMDTFKVPACILKRDDSDDYGLRSSYSLYFIEREQEPRYIGPVTIMRQPKSVSIHGSEKDSEDDFCSMGLSLDYYERLSLLNKEMIREVMAGLRDIIWDVKILDAFKVEESFRTVFRNSGKEYEEWCLMARALLTRDFRFLPKREQKIQFNIPAFGACIHLSFNELKGLYYDVYEMKHQKDLSSRVALIMCEGSEVLNMISWLAFASGDIQGRSTLDRVGKIYPVSFEFSRVLCLSFSAFNSFKLPGKTWQEREQIAHDVTGGEGRYVYCGIRDIVQEFQKEPEIRDRVNFCPIEMNSDRPGIIKSSSHIAWEFEKVMNKISEKNREHIIRESIGELFAEPSFQTVAFDYSYMISDPRNFFLQMRTSDRIALSAIAFLVANIEERSIILFHEPEINLNPPAVRTLFRAIMKVLEKKYSLCIMNTNSPVLLEETINRHIGNIFFQEEINRNLTTIENDFLNWV